MACAATSRTLADLVDYSRQSRGGGLIMVGLFEITRSQGCGRPFVINPAMRARCGVVVVGLLARLRKVQVINPAMSARGGFIVVGSACHYSHGSCGLLVVDSARARDPGN